MARYITVTVGCDWDECGLIEPEDSGLITGVTLSIDGKAAREFLLCKPHRDEFDEVVLPLMQKGVKVEAPAKATRAGSSRRPTPPEPGTPEADSLVCKVEGCARGSQPLANRTGFAQHVIRAHGYADLADYEAEFGPVAKPSTS
jgi:hypothetical protein